MSNQYFTFFFITFTCIIPVKSQELFNKVYDNRYSLIINHVFHTTDTFLYACEYQNFRFGAGGMVTTKIDKKTGSKIIIDSLYQDGEYIGLIQKPNKVIYNNRMLYYLVGVDGTNLFSIDTMSGKVSNEFIFNSPDTTKGIITSDLLMSGDTILLFGTQYDRVTTRSSRSITWIHNDWNTTILIPNKISYYDYAIEKVILLSNNNFLTFGHRINNNLQKINAMIAEVDRHGNILNEIATPDADFTGDVQDVLQINDDEYIILCLSSSKAPVYFDAKYYHTVYKYNHKTHKIVWRHRILEGLSNEFGLRSSIIAGHQPNEYLYAGMASADLTGQDTTHTVGRIVKLKGDGSVIWNKSYTHFIKKGNANRFYDIISSDTSHYYATGTTADGSFHPWLIKIDEDGNVATIDTTTLVKEINLSFVKVYPNPSSSEITMVIPDYKLRDKISVKVFDIMGKVVYEQAISTDILTIDIERWTSGVFTYVIDHNSQKSQGKFVKID